MKLSTLTLTTGLLVLTSPVVNASLTYNLAGDFTVASNPNGPWSYGVFDSSNGDFVPLLYAAQWGNMQYWYGGGQTNIWFDSGLGDFVQLISSAYTVDIRFTAPENGYYYLDGDFYSYQGSSSNLILVNDSPWQSYVLTTAGALASINGGFWLAAGSTVDFRTLFAGAPYDVGLRLTIDDPTRPAPVPEPATWLLLGSGLLGWYGQRRGIFPAGA